MQEKIKILFIVPYPYDCAPSQRLKFEQYYQIFDSEGFKITHSSFIGKSLWKIIYKPGNYFLKIQLLIGSYLRRTVLLFKIKKYNIIYLHLWGTPFGPALYEWIIRKLANKIIYDIDD